jgi:hypothetical protein
MIQRLQGARQIFENFHSLKGRGQKKRALVTKRLSFLLPLHSSEILSTQANEKPVLITYTDYSEKQNKRDDSTVRECYNFFRNVVKKILNSQRPAATENVIIPYQQSKHPNS